MAIVSHIRAATVLGELYAFIMLTRVGSVTGEVFLSSHVGSTSIEQHLVGMDWIMVCSCRYLWSSRLQWHLDRISFYSRSRNVDDFVHSFFEKLSKFVAHRFVVLVIGQFPISGFGQ